MACLICPSKSLTISNCLKDRHSIVFYLFAEEGSKVAMLLNEVNGRAKQLFKIQSSGDMVVELWRHGHIDIYVAAFMMFVASNRAKETHGSYAEPLLQFVGMAPDDIYIFASRFHSIITNGCIFSAKV